MIQCIGERVTSQKIASLRLLQWEQNHLNLTPFSLILSSNERLTSLFPRIAIEIFAMGAKQSQSCTLLYEIEQ